MIILELIKLKTWFLENDLFEHMYLNYYSNYTNLIKALIENINMGGIVSQHIAMRCSICFIANNRKLFGGISGFLDKQFSMFHETKSRSRLKILRRCYLHTNDISKC